MHEQIRFTMTLFLKKAVPLPQIITEMKKLSFILAVCALFLVSCQNPSKSRVCMDEGNKLMMRYSKFDEAEEAFTKAIKYDKNNAEAYYLRGCAKINSRKYDEALLDFQKAIDLKPDYADAYYNAGRTCFYINDYEMMCYYYKLAKQYGRMNLEDLMRSCD